MSSKCQIFNGNLTRTMKSVIYRVASLCKEMNLQGKANVHL